MGFFTGLLTDVVVGALSDKETRDSLIKGSKSLISSIFDEDGNGELDENELNNFSYAEMIDVMLMGYISELEGINGEWIEDYAQGIIDGKFDEDGAFNPSFCENNDLSPRKVKNILNECFDERDSIDEISDFADSYELGEIYFRTAVRAVLFASYDDGSILLNDEQNDFLNRLSIAFSISKLEFRSIQREYKNEALEWWAENS